MQIKEELPQFKDTQGLIIVTSQHEARFYYAADGIFEKIDEFIEERPRYSDREGFFASRNRKGTIARSGSVYEEKQDAVLDKFLNKFEEHFKKATTGRKVDGIYLFAPRYVLSDIKERIPAASKTAVRFSFPGNYTHEHPFKLLERIQNEGSERVASPPIKKEAAKILEKTSKALKVIKGKIKKK